MRVGKRLRARVVKIATRLAVRRGVLDQAEAEAILKEVEDRDWIDFLEWLMENWPEILEMIMAIIALF